MAWVESHQGLARHPKTHRLMATLAINRREAIGLLHLIWWWGLDYALDGDLSRYRCEDIADAAEWPAKDAHKLCTALREAGFLDPAETGPGHIHDWRDFTKGLQEAKAVASEDGIVGNHLRWHVQKKRPKVGCVLCFPQEAPPELIGGESGAISGATSPRVGGRVGGESGAISGGESGRIALPNRTVPDRTNRTEPDEEKTRPPEDARGGQPPAAGGHAEGPAENGGEVPSPKAVLEAWNSKAKTAGFQAVLVLTRTRETQIRARFREPFFREHWLRAMDRAASEPFCRGENERSWKATLDWFLRPNTAARLLEGAYGRDKKRDWRDVLAEGRKGRGE